MGGHKPRRPWVRLPVGFRQDHALTPEQFDAYFALLELGIPRFADRGGDRFECLGSALSNALNGIGVANAVRRLDTLPSDLARLRKHPKRKRVWIVELPGFGEIQGFSGSADRGEGGEAEASGSPVTHGQPRGSRVVALHRPTPDPELAGVADGKISEVARVHEAPSPSPSPSPSPTSTPSPSSRGKSQFHGRQEKASLPSELPVDLRDRVRSLREHLALNVRHYIDDDDYLANEYARFRRWHEDEGTSVKNVKALFEKWLASPQTGERAHERRKVEIERLAEQPDLSGLLASARPGRYPPPEGS